MNGKILQEISSLPKEVVTIKTTTANIRYTVNFGERPYMIRVNLINIDGILFYGGQSYTPFGSTSSYLKNLVWETTTLTFTPVAANLTVNFIVVL